MVPFLIIQQRNGELVFDRIEQLISSSEGFMNLFSRIPNYPTKFVWESEYTKQCQDKHLILSKIEGKKQLQIENSGFVKPYHEQINYQITKNSFRVKNVLRGFFLQKKVIQQKGASCWHLKK